MAQSWQRLRQGRNIQKHDKRLMRHEFLEQGLLRRYNYSYEEGSRKGRAQV